ncbi:hypothetical protein BDR06DRAFT_472945 [Suillus hirtellus]|nr:hypothetical protein BDR06DRAFT_472945 [Suillus hirtellus]
MRELCDRDLPQIPLVPDQIVRSENSNERSISAQGSTITCLQLSAERSKRSTVIRHQRRPDLNSGTLMRIPRPHKLRIDTR